MAVPNIRSIYDRLPSDRRWMITIRGAGHYMFSEGAVLRIPLLLRALRTVGIGPMDGRRQLTMTTRFISTFFDVYLKGAPDSELRSLLGSHEIESMH